MLIIEFIDFKKGNKFIFVNLNRALLFGERTDNLLPLYLASGPLLAYRMVIL